jgi:hypothetical protein
MIAYHLKFSINAPVEAWRQFAGLCELVKSRKHEITKPEGQPKGMAFGLLLGVIWY